MDTFRDIARHLEIYRQYIGRRMYLVLGLTILTALAQGFGITLLLPLLKASQAGGTQAGEAGAAERLLQQLLEGLGIAGSMPGILAFIAFVFVAKGALQFANNGYQGYLQSRLLRRMKARLFDLYNGMDYRYYIRHNTGHFINVINEQVNQFFQSFSRFASFVTQVVTTASYFAFAFFITWRFSLMALGLGVMLFGAFRHLNVYVRRLSRRRSAEMSHLNKLLVQTLQAFKYIVSTGQVTHLRSGVMNSIRDLAGYIYRQRLAEAFTAALREPFSVLVICGLVAVQVMVFEKPVAPIFVALLLFHRGMQALIATQAGLQGMMGKLGSVEMVRGEFATVEQHQERGGTQRLEAFRESIVLEEVSFAYDETEGPVLYDLSLTIEANTTVAFVGGSGAGKSTLVDLLTLLLRPQRGTVRIDGVPGSDVDLASWRRQIGYVSQETVIFDDTVANNISLWAGGDSEPTGLQKRVRRAAEQAHAADFIEALPEGYRTVVGDRGVRLSGGQRQRLFVARELFKEPNLLILDEATSALDTESERAIQQSIDALKGKVTVVVIAHRLSTIKNVDCVYVLDEGRIVERGTYRELREQSASRFRQMVEMQWL